MFFIDPIIKLLFGQNPITRKKSGRVTIFIITLRTWRHLWLLQLSFKWFKYLEKLKKWFVKSIWAAHLPKRGALFVQIWEWIQKTLKWPVLYVRYRWTLKSLSPLTSVDMTHVIDEMSPFPPLSCFSRFSPFFTRFKYLFFRFKQLV